MVWFVNTIIVYHYYGTILCCILLKDRLAIAIRSLKNRCVTIVSFTHTSGIGVTCGWCLAYCTGVVLNTVREVPRLILKKTRQADAGSRLFSNAFSVRLVVFHRQSIKVYLHMSNGNVQQNPVCAASCH